MGEEAPAAMRWAGSEVDVESRSGCCSFMPLVMFVVVAVTGILVWQVVGGLEGIDLLVRDFTDFKKAELVREEEPPSALLDTGQVIVGDFQILKIDEIWAEGDVVAAMSVAIEKDPKFLRRMLEEEGIDPNLRLLYGNDHWTVPLEKAVRQGSQETFEILLAAGSDPNGQASSGRTALHEAARKGYLTVIEQLLAAGADTELLMEHGGAAIESAARAGHFDEVELLLASGAKPRFALAAAASGNHVEILRLLLAAGADPRALSQYGDGPLRFAASKGHLEAVELLLDAGSWPQQQALREAAQHGQDEVLRIFARAGVRFDGPPAYWDPLFAAAHQGLVETVELLLELGASPHGGDGLEAPMHAAEEQGHVEVVALLEAAGAERIVEAPLE